MVVAARQRAKKAGVPFDLTAEDIAIPDACPVLGIPLEASFGRSTPQSPSLDRVIPKLGYVKGNVLVVSNRANVIKGDASVEELGLVYLYYRELLNGRQQDC